MRWRSCSGLPLVFIPLALTTILLRLPFLEVNLERLAFELPDDEELTVDLVDCVLDPVLMLYALLVTSVFRGLLWYIGPPGDEKTESFRLLRVLYLLDVSSSYS